MSFSVQDHGSIWVIEPTSDAAIAWVDEYVEIPSYMRQGPGFAADWRMARDIVDAMIAAGFEVLS